MPSASRTAKLWRRTHGQSLTRRRGQMRSSSFKAFQPLLDRVPVRRAAQRRQSELIEAVSTELDALKAAVHVDMKIRAVGLDVLRGATGRRQGGWARQVDERLREQL